MKESTKWSPAYITSSYSCSAQSIYFQLEYGYRVTTRKFVTKHYYNIRSKSLKHLVQYGSYDTKNQHTPLLQYHVHVTNITCSEG